MNILTSVWSKFKFIKNIIYDRKDLKLSIIPTINKVFDFFGIWIDMVNIQKIMNGK